MLPPKWLFQPDQFQTLPAEWIQGWTQTFRPIIWKANMFLYTLGTFNFFTVFRSARVSWLTCDGYPYHGQFRDENNILNLIHEEQICPEYKKEHDFFLQCLKKFICAIFIHSGWSIPPVTYIYTLFMYR